MADDDNPSYGERAPTANARLRRTRARSIAKRACPLPFLPATHQAISCDGHAAAALICRHSRSDTARFPRRIYRA